MLNRKDGRRGRAALPALASGRAPAHEGAGAPDRGARAAARRRAAGRPARGRRRLTLLQIDPTAAIAPSADLVAWSRLGSATGPTQLKQALERGPHAVRARRAGAADERPRPLPRRAPRLAADYERPRDWLARQRPLPARRPRAARRVRPARPRATSRTRASCRGRRRGWTNNRNVTQMLEFLAMRGEVAIAGRVGRERLWDLRRARLPGRTSSSRRSRRRGGSGTSGGSRALGIARAKARAMPMEPIDVGDAGEPAVVEGVEGRVAGRPGGARRATFEGRTALLSPFDRLVHDRVRAAGAVRLRVHARDVQAGGEAALGLLRAADPPRRPARREARRDRRPQGAACCA